LFFKAYKSITCVDKLWYCSSVKSTCSNGLFNSTLTVSQACQYTCGVCRSNFIFLLLLFHFSLIMNFLLKGTNATSVSTTTKLPVVMNTTQSAVILSPDDQCKRLFPNGSFCHQYSSSMCRSLVCRRFSNETDCYSYTSNIYEFISKIKLIGNFI